MLHEITCFFLGGMETPNVWLITAFWTGSIVLKLGNRPTGEELSMGKVMKGFMSRPDCIIRDGERTSVGSVLL